MKIAVVPEVEDLDVGIDLVARLGFYFAHLEPDEVVIPVAHQALGAKLQEEAAAIADNAILLDLIDPVVAERVGRLAPVLRFPELASGSGPAGEGVAAAIGGADLVLTWDENGVQREPWARLLEARGKAGLRPDWNVDKHRKRLEGSMYIEAAYRSCDHLDDLVEKNQAKFHELFLRLGHHDRVYVFGTGPSVDRYADFDFSDGLSIVCNTIVLDHELLDHVQPRILAFADPLFHFGISRYAAEFRAAAAEAAEHYDLAIVVPLKYYELFVSLLPDLEGRTIGVPMDPGGTNLDLLADYRVRSYANVLTLLMLPLAVTFGRRVGIIGCDGRAPAGEDYFWRHNPRTQLLHLIDNVAQVHPAFFDVDYEAYYEDHTTLLNELITQGEMMGVEFDSVTPSYIPVLARRAPDDGAWRAQLREVVDTAADFVWLSLNPDCEDEFGHYSPYDARVREAAAAAGGDLVTLASRAYRGGDANEGKAVAVFTHNSFAVTRDPPELFVDSFRRELREIVAEAAALGLGRDVRASFLMYPGSARHLMVMLELAEEFAGSGMQFLVNLFYAHPELHGPQMVLERGLNPTSIVLNATRSLRARLGVRAFVDTEELRTGLLLGTGETLPMWPMFSTTKLPPTPVHDGSSPPARVAGPVMVYNPGNLQHAKGYDLFADVVAAMRDDARTHSIRFVARELIRPGTDRTLLGSTRKLRDSGALILEGTLTDEEYARRLESADIIAIPYRRDPFLSRTSAVLSDAMLLGKPIVATAGTWAGRQVEEYGVGTTFAQDDVGSFRRAILRVVRDYGAFRERAARAAVIWSERYNPDRFVEGLRAAETSVQSEAAQGAVAAVLASIDELLAVQEVATAGLHSQASPAQNVADAPAPSPPRRRGAVVRAIAKLGDLALRPFPQLHARVQRRYWQAYGG